MEEPLFRDAPPVPVDVEKCEGSYVVGKDGKRYLDFMMGWCVGNAGWNKETLMDAIKSFDGPVYVAPTYKYERWEDLAGELVSLMPSGDYTCFRATGGTEAVELALKISRTHNRRKKFVAFKGAYHGQSLACLGLVGIHEKKIGPYPDYYTRLSTDWEEAGDAAVKAIKSGEISAFISEPLLCNLGVLVPPKHFFERVKEACEETDTLLIMDEVATGFGRTGKMFGFEHYGLEPDIVTVAKGFSSGYAPIGATIAKKEIAESMRFDFSNYSTFGWHPVAVECVMANIEYLSSDLIGKSEETGKVLMKRISEFCEPEGKGLCIGFPVKNSGFDTACLKDGLLLSAPLNNRVVVFPALDIGEKEVDSSVDIMKKNY